ARAPPRLILQCAGRLFGDVPALRLAGPRLGRRSREKSGLTSSAELLDPRQMLNSPLECAKGASDLKKRMFSFVFAPSSGNSAVASAASSISHFALLNLFRISNFEFRIFLTALPDYVRWYPSDDTLAPESLSAVVNAPSAV